MKTLSHQTWLHIFTHCSLVQRGGSDGPIPAKGVVMFIICYGSLLLSLETREISYICHPVFVYNSAEPAVRHFYVFKNCRGDKSRHEMWSSETGILTLITYSGMWTSRFLCAPYQEYDQNRNEAGNWDTKVRVSAVTVSVSPSVEYAPKQKILKIWREILKIVHASREKHEINVLFFTVTTQSVNVRSKKNKRWKILSAYRLARPPSPTGPDSAVSSPCDLLSPDCRTPLLIQWLPAPHTHGYNQHKCLQPVWLIWSEPA